VVVRRLEFFFLHVKTVGLRCCQIFWKGRLLFVVFGIIVCFRLLACWVSVDLGLNSLIDICITYEFNVVVSLAIVELLLRFVSDRLNLLLNIVEILLSFCIKCFESIPIQQMTPKGLTIMKSITLLRRNFITT
jgi:hypothetical protein